MAPSPLKVGAELKAGGPLRVTHMQRPVGLLRTDQRTLRCAVIRRRLSFGSNSADGAKFAAIMHSVVGTLSMHGIDVLRRLKACANNGGKPPDDLSPWLPWTMSERARSGCAPSCASDE